MTAPRLAGLAVDVADHPIAVARRFGALGLHVAVLDGLAEIRLDDGTVLRLRHSEAPTRIALRLAVPDLAAVALALDEHRGHTSWEVAGPNVIRIGRGDLTVEVTEGRPGLTDVTMFVGDVARSARFWQSLGLTVIDTTPAENDPADPPEPAADVQLAGVTIQLRGCGLRPITFVHMVIRVADPLGCRVGLDHAGWDYRQDGDAVVTARTPDGCGVRVTRQRR